MLIDLLYHFAKKKKKLKIDLHP